MGWKWFEVKIFISNHFRTHAQREREREIAPRERSNPEPICRSTSTSNRTQIALREITSEPRALRLLTLRLRHSTSTLNRTQIAPREIAGEPRAQSPLTSHPSTSPFDFDFESHPNRTLWLHRRTQSPNQTFDFAEIAPKDRTEMAPIALRSQLRNGWVLMNLARFDRIWWIFFGWVLFLCLSTEKWYYIFVWKLRKCEEQEENVFSILFSAIQPNTRKYFPKHFLECNQTLENIFLSRK